MNFTNYITINSTSADVVDWYLVITEKGEQCIEWVLAWYRKERKYKVVDWLFVEV